MHQWNDGESISIAKDGVASMFYTITEGKRRKDVE
jgi:hypothetical protein